jgi:hypothetical protein
LSGILTVIFVNIPVKEKNKSKLKRVDFLGGFLLVATLVLLLLGLNSGGNIVPWSHPLVISSLCCSVVALLAFVFVEDRIASEPIIPVRLLLNRTVLAACLTNWFTTMGLFGLFYYGPVYFQVRGFSATQAGLRLTPQSIGVGLGSFSSGLIMRATGRYWLLNATTEGMMVIATILVASTFDLDTAVGPPFVYFFMMGFGYASMLTITLIALISAVDHIHQAVITSASYAFRSTGSSIGITIASAVFQNLLKRELWTRFGDYPDAADKIKKVRDSIDEIKTLPESWKQGVLDAYMDALGGVFWTVVGLTALGVVISLFMRENVLHKTLARK